MDATILYTSGTTGHPKGAVSTHRAVLSALVAFACRVARERRDGRRGPKQASPDPTSFILVVPLFHVTGCVAVMLSCFAAGYKLVMMHKWEPARALELIERERITQLRRRADAVLGSARVPRLRAAATPRASPRSAAAARPRRRSWCGAWTAASAPRAPASATA